jgi:hypothetical protein
MNDREPTSAPAPQTGVYGSDRWHTMAGAEWSYWDLWFCAVCVADHDGDWDALDAAIQQTQRWCGESLWCHLVDLTARLDAAGLTAADLLAACPTRRGLLPKARTKVLKSTPSRHERTPPMRDLPSVRLYRRALFGAWKHFPQSPRPWYDSLEAQFNLERRPNGDGWATQELVYDISVAQRRFLDRAGGDPAGVLAVRRATLTFYFLVAQDFDDSYGAVGEMAAEAVKTYAALDWRSAGIDPEVFWRDLLEWSTQADDYGLLNQIEIDVLRTAGVARDLDLVETILAGLASEYTAARQAGHAGECTRLRFWAVVAAEAFDRFEATVTATGTPWTVLTSMIDTATARDRLDLAMRLLDLADTTATASRHRDWVRQRRTELSAPTTT